MKKWRAKKRPLLSGQQAKVRLAWALDHQYWTKEDWEGVVWSDECSVEKSKDPRTVWVIRNLYEKWEKDCIAPFHKGPDVKLMVWACFWGRNKGTFVPIILRSVDQWVYRDLLESCLLPVLQRVQDTIGDPVFMQDNARVHTARHVTDWLDENNVQVMDWPPYSPDLNPIEHVWVRLKEGLHKRFPDIANTPGGPDKVRERLSMVLPEIWEKDIEGDFLEKLWESMPQRVAAVIEANGWYTKY
jgi:transposase